MSGAPTDEGVQPEPEAPGRSGRTTGQRVRRVTAWVVGLTVYVWVMFTWVFPWLVDSGLSPTLEG